MTAKVSSITELRANARRRALETDASHRAVTFVVVAVAALAVIGLAATISASSVVGIADQSDKYFFLKRQLFGLGLGVVALAVFSKLHYSIYRRMALPLFGASVLLLGLVLVPGIGHKVGGSRAWFDLGPISFQPSELSKFTVIVATAAVMERKHRVLDDFAHFLAPVALFVGVTSLLVMGEPDLGTTIVIGMAAMAVLVTSVAPLRYVVGTGLLAGLAATALALADTERRSRLTSFLNPWADPLSEGYQLVQSYYALGNGGILGVGLGSSRARWFFLPSAHTDFIFAIIGEETGLAGGLVVLGLFALLAGAGWAIAHRAADPFGRMLAAGITAWIIFQAVINVGGVVGVLPITGITLPFVSYGGTSMVVTLAAIGVLINVARAGPARRKS